jgi:hypothetical protein
MIHDQAAVPCAPWLMQRIEHAIAEGLTPFSLPSGAGYDALTVQAIADLAMIFVRCAGGISHNPAEAMTAAGTRVLLLMRRSTAGTRRNGISSRMATDNPPATARRRRPKLVADALDGLIKGGINTNLVPDLVTLRLDRCILPEDNPFPVDARTGPAGRAPAAQRVHSVGREIP